MATKRCFVCGYKESDGKCTNSDCSRSDSTSTTTSTDSMSTTEATAS